MLVLSLLFADLNGGLYATGEPVQWEYGEVVGANVWETRLSANTLNETTDDLVWDLPDLSALQRPVLLVEHQFDFGLGDYGVVGLFETDLEPLVPIYQTQPEFEEASPLIVSAFELPATSSQSLHFRLVTDSVGSGPGWTLYSVSIFDGDPVAPDLQVLSSPAQITPPQTATWEIFAVDDVAVTQVQVDWTHSLGANGVIEATAIEEFRYEASVDFLEPGEVQWVVRASDGSNISSREGSFEVALAPPTHLSATTAVHDIATDIELSWLSPPTAPLRYEVLDFEQELVLTTVNTSAFVPLAPQVPQVFSVRAVYADGGTAISESIELDVTVPELLHVAPSLLIPGETRWIRFEGSNLGLLEGDCSFAIDAVEVLSVEVIDFNTASVQGRVVEAASGLLGVQITAGGQVLRFDSVFTALDSTELPMVESIEPSSLDQGQRITLRITASEPFGEQARVQLDDDLIQTSEVTVHGNLLELPIAINTRARLGVHTLIIDDGQRLWSVGLLVDEYKFVPAKQCSTAPERGAAWLGAFILLMGLQRRREGTVEPR